MAQYPEIIATLPDILLMNAFVDTNMLAPLPTANATPGPLFPPSIVTVKLGGDAALNDKSGVISLPLETIYITIGSHYGAEEPYTLQDANAGTPLAVAEVTVPFTVWGSSAIDVQDVRQRLIFAMDHRKAVFSANGLSLLGKMVPERKRAFDARMGLVAEDHRWHFFWERT